MDELRKLPHRLHLDNAPNNQPEGTYRFALNAVEAGEEQLANEPANFLQCELPADHVILGHVYIGDHQTCVFSTNPETRCSEIGVVMEKGEYKAVIRDGASSLDEAMARLNFSIEHQVYGVFRLRNGSERNVYWVDGLNRPRCINLDRLDQYRNKDGSYNYKAFDLFISSKRQPQLRRVEVVDSGGNLKPGSYNVALQYLDASLNATEWMCASLPVLVYNDSLKSPYFTIGGSCISAEYKHLSYPETSKSIEVDIDDLDDSFPYYRLALVEYNSGTGQSTRVGVTVPLSTKHGNYALTGTNTVEEIPIQDVSAIYDSIETARHIEQLQDRLLLGHVTKAQINWCELQRYASQIQADCVVRPAIHGNLRSERAGKSPQVLVSGASYMPGEVYSFGIVYILDDGTVSPVFHIPGKAKSVPQKTTYSVPQRAGDRVYGMAHHEMADGTRYVNRSACGPDFRYWGNDASGVPLEGNPVRHHRFPTRKEIGQEHFYADVKLTPRDVVPGTYKVDVEVMFIKSCTEQQVLDRLCEHKRKPADPFCVKVEAVIFNFDGEHTVTVPAGKWQIEPKIDEQGSVAPGSAVFMRKEFRYIVRNHPSFANKKVWFRVKVAEGHLKSPINPVEPEWHDAESAEGKRIGVLSLTRKFVPYGEDGQAPKPECSPCVSTDDRRGRFTTYPLSIQFSNIKLPRNAILDGRRIVGYQIVRQERTDADKEVLDTGIVLPLIHSEGYKRYASTGLIVPAVEESDGKVKRNYHRWLYNERVRSYNSKIGLRVLNCGYNLIFPTNLFFEDKQPQFTHVQEEGYFDITSACFSAFGEPDVMDGTSYDKSIHDKWEADKDGWKLFVQCREHRLAFKTDTFPAEGGCYVYKAGIDKIFYLKALQSVNWADGGHVLYNSASDNRACVVTTRRNIRLRPDRHIPYVTIRRENSSAYADWQTRPYYPVENGYVPLTLEEKPGGTEHKPKRNQTHLVLGGGDVFISPMRFVQSTFVDNIIPMRSTQQASTISVWKIVLGIVAIVAGALAAVFTAGTSLLGAITIAGALFSAAFLLIKSGVEQQNIVKAYREDWAAGLRMVARDGIIQHHMIGKDIWYNASGDPVYTETNKHVGPPDDTLMWCVMSLNDVYFESPVNVALRHQLRMAYSYFLQQGDTDFENWNNTIDGTYDHYSQDAYGSIQQLGLRKLTLPNDKRARGKEYAGVAIGEYYGFNPDYNRMSKERKYFMLPLSYICCGNRREEFERRVQYSDVSHQEEFSDGYRKFRVNNYIDIEGDTGALTNLFTVNGKLYAHTEFGLYHLPENIQERVNSGGLVSYIGTGDFFSLKPQKIVDDSMHSGGLQHKLSVVKTPYGVYFVSEHERAVYHFNGRELQRISDHGMRQWFWGHLHDNWLAESRMNHDSRGYKHLDNLSHPIGVGCTMTYDEGHDRLLLTKQGMRVKPTWPSLGIRPQKPTEDYLWYKKHVYDRAENGKFSVQRNGKVYVFAGVDYHRDELARAVEERYQAELRAYVKRHYPNDPYEQHEAEAMRNVPRENSWTYRGVHDDPSKPDAPALLFSRMVTKRGIRKEKRKRWVERKGLEGTYVVFAANTHGWEDEDHAKWLKSMAAWRKRHPEVRDEYLIDLTRDKSKSIGAYLQAHSTLRHVGLLKKYYQGEDPVAEAEGKRILIVHFVENDVYHGVYVDKCDAEDFGVSRNENELTAIFMPEIRTLYRACDRFQEVAVLHNCFADYWMGQILTNDFPMAQQRFYELHRNAPNRMKVSSDTDWRMLKSQMLVPEPKHAVHTNLVKYGGLHRYGLSVEVPESQVEVRWFDPEELDSWIGEWPSYSVEEEYEEDVWHSWEELEEHWVPGIEWSYPTDERYAWTMSYSLATKSWVSWHSYTPYCYIRHGNSFLSAELLKPNKLYSHQEWNDGTKHPSYQLYYEREYPMIVEIVGRAKGDDIKTWEDFAWRTTAVWYDRNDDNPVTMHDATFTQVMLYNENQNTGWLGLRRHGDEADCMMQAVQEPDPRQILMSRKENVWRIHTVRDACLNDPHVHVFQNRMFRTGIREVVKQYGHWIDKVLNDDAVDARRMDWSDRQPLRDSYICCRLVYDGEQASLINLTLHLHGFSELNSDR